MAGLKVVALISGGKDSLFSILHCHSNGHEVVALANLHPPTSQGNTSEDVESYMYQTVGHAVIPLYAEALNLPLYRQEISGTAINQSKSYSSVPSGMEGPDEVESLLPLLVRVMREHPEISAVSTGAILSDYQRTRVESVAIRLGLVPLSYLWQYPFLPPYDETSLLDDMISAGQDSRIIKVASGALDDSFLWLNVANPRTKHRLQASMARFEVAGGGAALGEGGEYETLAIDGPSPLWKRHIEIQENDRRVAMGEAGAASISISKASTVVKEKQSVEIETPLRIPDLLDDRFLKLRDSLLQSDTLSSATFKVTVDDQAQLIDLSFIPLDPAWIRNDYSTGYTIANTIAHGHDAPTQMRNIMNDLVGKWNVSPSNVIFSTILLRSMADFAAVNPVYGSFFRTPNPPARVTIACGDTLPSGVLISLSIVVLNDGVSEQKRGLHVQSRSYWAPANIGPYSQAITVPISALDHEEDRPSASIVHVAGQIPLIPASMELPPPMSNNDEHVNTIQPTVLSLQHLWRIGQVVEVQSWLGAVAFVSRCSDDVARGRVAIALEAWKRVHTSTSDDVDTEPEDGEDDNDVDVWDITYGQHYGSHIPSTVTGTPRNIRKEPRAGFVPPCFVAEIDSLPRNVDIEWASAGISKHDWVLELHVESTSSFSHHFMTTNSSIEENIPLAGWISLKNTEDIAEAVQLIKLQASMARLTFVIYATKPLPTEVLLDLKAQIVPCRRVWDMEGRRVTAVLAYRMV